MIFPSNFCKSRAFGMLHPYKRYVVLKVLTENGHEFILAPCNVCDGLAKLHGLEFQDCKTIIEEAKTPTRPLGNKLSTNAA